MATIGAARPGARPAAERSAGPRRGPQARSAAGNQWQDNRRSKEGGDRGSARSSKVSRLAFAGAEALSGGGGGASGHGGTGEEGFPSWPPESRPWHRCWGPAEGPEGRAVSSDASLRGAGGGGRRGKVRIRARARLPPTLSGPRASPASRGFPLGCGGASLRETGSLRSSDPLVSGRGLCTERRLGRAAARGRRAGDGWTRAGGRFPRVAPPAASDPRRGSVSARRP